MWQSWRLDDQTLALAAHYLAIPSPYDALFLGNRRPVSRSLRLSDRALNYRVQALGERIGLRGLLPRDCHRYWQKTFADTVTHVPIASWEGDPPAEEESAWDIKAAHRSREEMLVTPADAIAAHFRQWAEEIQAMYQEIDSLTDRYPRFREEQSYCLLLMHLSGAAEKARGLEDHILHAPDENWRDGNVSGNEHR